MAVIFHYFEKDTFVPEKNYFSTEKVQCSRHEDETELNFTEQSYKWTCIGWNSIGWGCLLGIIMMLTFGILGSTFSAWYYIGAGFGFASFVGGIIFANAVCWPKEAKYLELYREYYTKHEEELWAEATKEIKAYNEEQKKIAEAWRAEHPLEEKIRLCIKDPMSSVNIANLARYYAEVYLQEKSNDN